MIQQKFYKPFWRIQILSTACRVQVQTFKPIAAAIPGRGQSGRGALVQYCDAVGNTDRSPEIVEESHQAAIQAYRFQYMA